ncbi:hypothetical protein HG530_007749 [Fusarium avenaceum]|nr:hypothetical protein HG530_007749 [Fusarium avenaceum]
MLVLTLARFNSNTNVNLLVLGGRVQHDFGGAAESFKTLRLTPFRICNLEESSVAVIIIISKREHKGESLGTFLVGCIHERELACSWLGLLEEALGTHSNIQASLVQDNIGTVYHDLERTTAIGNLDILHCQTQRQSLIILDDEFILLGKVFIVSAIDDCEIACLEHSILHVNTEKQQMRKLNNVNWTDTSLSQKVGPVFLSILVVDAVFEVVWQEILQGHWRRELNLHIRILPALWVCLVKTGMNLEVERIAILSLADHLLSRSLKKISPEKVIVAPLIAEAPIRSDEDTLLKYSANRSRSRFAGSDLLNLEQVAFLGVVDTQLDWNLCRILHVEWRSEGHILDVVGSQLNFNTETMQDIISLRAETIQIFALSVESYVLHRIKATAFQLNGDVVLVRLCEKVLTHLLPVLETPRCFLSILQAKVDWLVASRALGVDDNIEAGVVSDAICHTKANLPRLKKWFPAGLCEVVDIRVNVDGSLGFEYKENIAQGQSQDKRLNVHVDIVSIGLGTIHAQLNRKVIDDAQARRLKLVHSAQEHSNFGNLESQGMLLREEHLLVLLSVDQLKTDGVDTEDKIKLGPFLVNGTKFRAKVEVGHGSFDLGLWSLGSGLMLCLVRLVHSSLACSVIKSLHLAKFDQEVDDLAEWLLHEVHFDGTSTKEDRTVISWVNVVDKRKVAKSCRYAHSVVPEEDTCVSLVEGQSSEADAIVVEDQPDTLQVNLDSDRSRAGA